MEKKPFMYLGKQPVCVEFVGVDRGTGLPATEEEETPRRNGEKPFERMDLFAEPLGYARVTEPEAD